MSRSLVIASRNRGKVEEFRSMLSPLGWQVQSLLDFAEVPDIEETGHTFMENASLKAMETAKALGLATIADDSGLCVDILEGKPGVYSARFAGEKADDATNNAKLVQELALKNIGNLPLDHPDRRARFVCALVYYDPDRGDMIKVEGECHGSILNEPRGQNGFGYDPLFYLPEWGKTMAELTNEQKNSISHRGQALQKLKEALSKLKL